jgi:8-oxo-dGTP diphosphatase
MYPRVGVAVIVLRKGLVLLGQRKGGYAPGQWAFPGGKLELQESWVDCGRREVYEEAGLRVQMDLEEAGLSNDVWGGQRHYVTIYMLARSNKGEAKVMEPDKCSVWGWFSPTNLPSPLFLPARNFLKKDPGLRRALRRVAAMTE